MLTEKFSVISKKTPKDEGAKVEDAESAAGFFWLPNAFS